MAGKGFSQVSPNYGRGGGGYDDPAEQIRRFQYYQALIDAKKIEAVKHKEDITESIEKRRTARQEETEKDLNKYISESTGQTVTPEMGPFFAESRRLSKGGEVTKPVGGKIFTDPATGLPGGSNLISLPATREDVTKSVEPGVQGYRDWQTRRITDVPGVAPEYEQYAKRQIGVSGEPVEEPFASIERATKAGQSISKTREDVAKAREAEVSGPARSETAISEAKIKGLDVTKREALQPGEIEAGKAKSIREQTEDIAKTKYAAIDAASKSKLEAANAAIADAKAKNIQIDRDKLTAETEHIKQENIKLKQETDSRDRQQTIINSLQTENDPLRRRQLFEALTAEMGGGTALLADDRDRQKEVMDRQEHIIRLGTTLDDALMSRNNRTPAEAPMLAEIYNRSALARADSVRDSHVTLRPIGVEKGIMGGETYKVGTARVPTGIARMFLAGQLERIASGKAPDEERIYTDTDGTQKVMTPSQALATWARISYSYTNDTKRWMEGIDQFGADPIVAAEAKRMLPSQTPSQTPGETPKAPITGSKSLPLAPESIPKTPSEIEERDIRESEERTAETRRHEDFLKWLSTTTPGKPIIQYSDEELSAKRKEYESKFALPQESPPINQPKSKPLGEIKSGSPLGKRKEDITPSPTQKEKEDFKRAWPKTGNAPAPITGTKKELSIDEEAKSDAKKAFPHLPWERMSEGTRDSFINDVKKKRGIKVR